MNSKKNVIKSFIKKIILPHLKPKAIVLIGSVSTKLSRGSDIDLVIFLEDKRLINFEDEIKNVKSTIKKFNLIQKNEISFIQDKENPRIELKIDYKGDIFDLVITNSKIYCGTYPEDISKDNFELYVGNLFVYGKMLFQKDNYYLDLQEEYLPYYKDKIRKIRMDGLKKEIERFIDQIKYNCKEGQIINAIYYINRSLQGIIQFKFIQRKTYPISYQKWIDYQFKKILKEEKFLLDLNSILKKTNLSSESILELSDYLLKIIKEIEY